MARVRALVLVCALFGLAGVSDPDQVRATVRWPSGIKQKVAVDRLDRYVTLVEEE